MIISTSGSIKSVALTGNSGTVLGSVSGLAEGSVEGALSRRTIVSYDGTGISIMDNPSLNPISLECIEAVTMYGFRVVLNGEDVSSDVQGNISVLRELDRLAMAELTLYGKKYSFLTTETTWTKTLVDIFFIQGIPGDISESLRFSGFVQRGDASGFLSYRLTLVDRGYESSKGKVCLELDPEAGRRRDSIASDVLLAAGFPSVDLPLLSVYNKPFNFAGEAFSGIVEFLEPESLHLRITNDGIVQGYTIDPSSPPRHIWKASELLERAEVTPPDSVPSAFIFRGDITISESVVQGVSIEARATPIYGIYNSQTTHQQSSAGVISERVFQLGKPHSSYTKLQLIKIVYSEIHSIGTRTILKIDRELEWKNPKSARYVTVVGAGGPGPQGTNFVACYIIDDDYVVWPSAKFIQTLERREVFLYDENGNDIGSVVDSYEFFSKTKGVQNPTGNPIAGIYVGGDNQSYDRNGDSLYQIEGYGLRSRFVVNRTYDTETGAEALVEQLTYGWYSIRRAVDGGYGLFDGSAQSDLTETFQLVEKTAKPIILDSSRRKVGEITVTSEYTSRESSIGAFDYGGHLSESETETLTIVSIEASEFSAFNSSFYSVTKYKNGRRSSEDFSGKPPVPRYLSSAYSRYVSQPVEIVTVDPLLSQWFGNQTQVSQVRHTLSLSELNSIRIRRISRLLSFQIRIIRHETLADIGDVVLFVDPDQGAYVKGVIISAKVDRERSISVGEYILEVPILETGLPL